MKKFLLMTSFLLLFCFNSNVFASNLTPYNEMTDEIAQAILDYCYEIEAPWNVTLANKIKNTSASYFKNYFNTNIEELKDIYPDITCLEQFILRYGSGYLYLIISNNELSNTLPFAEVKEVQSNTIGIKPWEFVIHFEGQNSLTSNIRDTSTDYIMIFGTDKVNEYITFDDNDVVIYIKEVASLFKYGTVYYTPPGSDTGKYYYLGDYLVERNIDEDIPGEGGGGDTSGDTGGDTGGDSGGNTGGDYTGQLNQIQNNLNNIENKIPTSGDIANSTQTGIVSGNTEFWGSTGDLSGDQQEELISGKIDELTNTLSGDLAENEIFGILQTYEDKLFGGFTGEEDFIISWNDVNYNGQKLIPSGEVNFSKICRENEALGNVKSTINIILTFIIMMNIVIYMYNLLLATLGIDNPYLYEKPVGSVTTSEYTDESGRTFVTTTQHDGRGNSISKRYNHTSEPKRRQIGFRKW